MNEPIKLIKDSLLLKQSEMHDTYYNLSNDLVDKYIEIKKIKEEKTLNLLDTVKKEKERILNIVADIDLKVPKFDFDLYNRLSNTENKNEVLSYFFEDKLRLVETYDNSRFLLNKIYFNENNMPLLKINYAFNGEMFYSFYNEGTEKVFFSYNVKNKNQNNEDSNFDYLKVYIEDIYLLIYFDKEGNILTKCYQFKSLKVELYEGYNEGYREKFINNDGNSIELKWSEDNITGFCINFNQNFYFKFFKFDIVENEVALEISNM